jgi:DNA-binding NarL/FixJ family response regulator
MARYSIRTLVDGSLRVVIADDEYLIREGTATLLAVAGGLDVVATAVDRDSLLSAVDEHRPDAVLTDIRMPPSFTREGIEAARQIRADHPEIGVVVLSQHMGDAYLEELFVDGAAGLGYLLKERVADVEELVRALQAVASGGSALDPKVVEQLLRRREERQASALGGITAREREVLEEMAAGRSNTAIMARLNLGERTVEKHIKAVFHKLGLADEGDSNRRVLAVLTFIRERATAPPG